MSPEKQRIAIAEYCGWKFDQVFPIDPQGVVWNVLKMQAVPYYLNDLNAMHEAEKVLKHIATARIDEQVAYSNMLSNIISKSKNGAVVFSFDKAHATATQRAEAFLKIIGKWEEELSQEKRG